MGIDLALIWAIIIAVGLMMYVVMDGFDLGIGIVFPFVKGKERRDIMVNSIAPVWDGNETWLVFGGAALFAAFPLAYATILSALYMPIILMLFTLILRGVAFEFRFKATAAHRPLWDRTFCFASYGTAFLQGVIIGAFINGFPMQGNTYTGGVWHWLSPFSLLTGIALPAAYALLGVTWLIMKTEGDLQKHMLSIAKPVALVLFVFVCIVSVWTPLMYPAIAWRWFALPNLFYLAPVPVLTVLTTWLLLRLLKGKPHAGPFLCSLFIIFMGYTGLAISIWPHIIPPAVTIWQAAAPAQSMGFTLVGALLIIPVIVGYTSWSYFVFKGKVKIGEGYH